MLVVDLDGTLVRSNMLFESFWSALSLNWATPFHAAAGLANGRARLKQRLAGMAAIDAASLPYDSGVLDYIAQWRRNGGRTALVTAADQGIADAIADHLGLFDAVHGSDGSDNLKGERKSAFLERAFGAGGYAYMGDSEADLPVWAKAGRAVSVNAPNGLRARLQAVAPDAEHIGAPMTALMPLVRAMRPHQWLKNLLVFIPMLLGHMLTMEVLGRSVLAFVGFSLIASSVYLLNDLLDLAADRAHPRKRLRPFASGALPIGGGSLLIPLLLLAGFACALSLSWHFTLVMLVYLAVTLAYSLRLKRLLVIDICTLAVLYTLRIIAGGAATDIPITVWLLAFSVFFFFALAAIKRQAELVDGIAAGRVTAHGRGYHIDDLPLVASMATSSGYVSVLVMALYLNSEAVQRLYHHPSVLWGICLVLLFWISRMVMITHRGNMHDDPVVFAARDAVSHGCALLIIAMGVVGALP